MSTMIALCVAVGVAAPRAMEAEQSIPVRVTNTPVPVQPVLDPVAFELCTAEGTAAVEKCQVIGNPPAYQVPSGRRLIIEQISGDCGGDGEPGRPLTVDVVARTKGVVVSHTIIGVPRPESVGGLIPLTLMRIYADPDSAVTIGLTGVPGVEGRFCRTAFSGQLVKP